MRLLGTPRVSSKNAHTSRQVEAGAPKSRLEDQVMVILNQSMALLGTPRASEYKGSGPVGSKSFEHGYSRHYLMAQALTITKWDWGKWEEAIRRWEGVMGPAPSPTLPDGRGGIHRLNVEFVEWMMGVRKGVVSSEDIDIPRSERIKALGNGVVPQQAQVAISDLMRVAIHLQNDKST